MGIILGIVAFLIMLFLGDIIRNQRDEIQGLKAEYKRVDDENNIYETTMTQASDDIEELKDKQLKTAKDRDNFYKRFRKLKDKLSKSVANNGELEDELNRFKAMFGSLHFKDGHLIYPGMSLKEIIDSEKISINALARKTGISYGTCWRMIHGKTEFTVYICKKLEKELGVSWKFWRNLELSYQLAVRAKERMEMRYL